MSAVSLNFLPCRLSVIFFCPLSLVVYELHGPHVDYKLKFTESICRLSVIYFAVCR